MTDSHNITKLNNSVDDVKKIILDEDLLEILEESKIYGKDVYRNFKWLQEFVESKSKYFDYKNYFNPKTNYVLIDNEMIDIVKHLNDIGIETFSSCCGHMRFKSYVAVKGFYQIPKQEGIEVAYLIISKSTVIYYGGKTTSSREYLRNILKFTDYICSLELNDFETLNINEVKFDNSLATSFAKYVLGLSNNKPTQLSNTAVKLYSRDLLENYPHEIIHERLNEFSVTKKMNMFEE